MTPAPYAITTIAMETTTVVTSLVTSVNLSSLAIQHGYRSCFSHKLSMCSHLLLGVPFTLTMVSMVNELLSFCPTVRVYYSTQILTYLIRM